jgi:bacillithiol biosynthesis cysteine-adding enzyme BshC
MKLYHYRPPGWIAASAAPVYDRNFMDRHAIPFSRVPRQSTLFQDYIHRYSRVERFYSGSPFDPASYQRVAEGVKLQDAQRRELAAILEYQNRHFGAPEETLANIRKLAEPGTFAVVTGQQTGLFTGPAFTIYKALTTISLSRHLNARGFSTVPVFWLATEDHDFEEVASAALLDGEAELVKFTAAGEKPAPRSPVGNIRFTPQITELLNAVENTLPEGEWRSRLLEDLRATYQPGATWGQAFGRFLTRLFGQWGVALLDPLDERVHSLSSRVLVQSLQHAARFRELLRRRSQALVSESYHVQVHVGDDATLLFALLEGNRVAVTERGGKYLLDGADHSTLRDVTAWVHTRPQDFSPSALLRPVMQDTLLPTLAYVAGPAELAYFAQSQALYPEFGRPLPVVFPRAAFTLLDHRASRICEKYEVGVEDVWQGEEHLRLRIAAAGFGEGGASGWSERLDRSEQELARILDGLREDVIRIDPTLQEVLKHAQEKMTYQLERVRGKMSRAAFERSAILTRHEQELARFVMPHKNLQEREVSGIYFLARCGYGLLEQLLAQIAVDSAAHLVCCLG